MDTKLVPFLEALEPPPFLGVLNLPDFSKQHIFGSSRPQSRSQTLFVV